MRQRAIQVEREGIPIRDPRGLNRRMALARDHRIGRPEDPAVIHPFHARLSGDQGHVDGIAFDRVDVAVVQKIDQVHLNARGDLRQMGGKRRHQQFRKEIRTRDLEAQLGLGRVEGTRPRQYLFDLVQRVAQRGLKRAGKVRRHKAPPFADKQRIVQRMAQPRQRRRDRGLRQPGPLAGPHGRAFAQQRIQDFQKVQIEGR